jgi:cation transport regulator ChaC
MISSLNLYSFHVQAKVWGAAYKIHQRDIDRVVQHLDLREVMGYEKVPIEFHPIPSHPQNVLEPASPFDYNNVAKNLVANRPDRLALNEDTEEDEGISLVTPSSSGQSPSSPDGILEYSDNDSHAHEISQGKVFTVFMYYGSSENEHYIGPAPVESMAKQIFESIGPSGKNKEYLFKLCQAMRQICDEAMDNHLVELEDAVRELEVEYNLRSPGTPIEL